MLTFEEKTLVNNFMVAIQRANLETDIKFVKAKREKNFLKVTICRNGIEDWYHVLKDGTWY